MQQQKVSPNGSCEHEAALTRLHLHLQDTSRLLVPGLVAVCHHACPAGKFLVSAQLRHSQGAIAGCMDCSMWPILHSVGRFSGMTPRATDECAAEPRRLIASAEGDEPPEADDDNVIKDEILDNRPKPQGRTHRGAYEPAKSRAVPSQSRSQSRRI